MKKLSLLIAVSLLASTFAAVPALASDYFLRSLQPALQGSDEERAAYEAVNNEKDPAKKLALSKEFVKKFPDSKNLKVVEAGIYGIFYNEKDPAKKLSVAREYMKMFPKGEYAKYIQQFIITSL